MSLPLPTGLSPSKVASFTECGLAFRFSAIDHLPEPPAIHLARGTLVHRALELLFCEAPADRTVDAALAHLRTAHVEVLADPENDGLVLEDEDAYLADAETLVRNYFQLEDPSTVRAVGLELRLEAELGSLKLRGIIDRLDLDENGELIVVDYKTGSAPGVQWEGRRLVGVQFYAFLCEQVLGRRPAAIRLLHLKEPLSITSVPTDQSIRGLTTKTKAIWTAIETACERDDFRPKQSRLCDFCAYKEWCPAFGGNPADAPRPELAVSA
jgi:putative RecB family exonuclease